MADITSIPPICHQQRSINHQSYLVSSLPIYHRQELQKKLSDITKANETAQKQQSEAMVKLQAQMKEQNEAHTKQQQEFNASLKKMQETNGELNKSLSKLTIQNTQAAEDLNDAREKQRPLERQLHESSGSVIWKVIALVMLVAFLAALLFQ